MTKDYDLIIIGGGCAGLSSALHLLKNGFRGKIGLVEARDRFGGRILTSRTKIEEKKIEIGANWIHGIIDNPIYELLYRHGILNTANIGNDRLTYNVQALQCDNDDGDGQFIDQKLIRRVYERYSLMLKNTARFLTGDHDDELIMSKYNDSMGRYLDDEIDKWIASECKDDTTNETIYRQLFASLIRRETCISGCDQLYDVSLKYFDQYKEFLGPHITISAGYCSLINVLLEEIDQFDTIDDEQGPTNDQNGPRFEYHLECPVKHVRWPGFDGHNDEMSNFPIEIECESPSSHNGGITKFRCKHLISTLPLSYLKKHIDQDLFIPQLPRYKIDCIHRMGIDIVDKLFMEYSCRSLITELFERNNQLIDEIMLLWPQSDVRKCNNGHNTTLKRPWYEKIYSIYRISEHCIQLWLSGVEAAEFEQLTERQINDQLTEVFRRIFGRIDFPPADNVICTRWGRDPYALGSYSYISRNSSPEDIELLAKPIYLRPTDEYPAIVFSGEATHAEYFSTVHGAYLTGRTAAEIFTNQS